ncbi:hypothetical protein FOZ63_020017, partial [Perkinsus olseni]
LFGSAAGQGTVVGIEQERIPFQNGRTGATFSSPIGTLTHIQTLRLRHSVQDVFAGDKLRFTSIAVAEDGSELLAVSSDQGGHFVTLDIQQTDGDEYNIATATVYPLVGPDGKKLNVVAPTGTVPPLFDIDGEYLNLPASMSLAVNGTYRRGGQGDFTVAYLAERFEALRFPSGVSTRNSTLLDVPDLYSVCDSLAATITRLNPRGDLLGICQWLAMVYRHPYHGIPGFTSAWVYSGNTFHHFLVETIFGYNPSAVAALKNGDLMIAFVVHSNPKKLRITYVTSAELTESINTEKTLNPLIIAEIDQAEGFEIGVQSAMAVREDPESGRIMVYSMSDDAFSPQRTLLTTFEWTPNREPRPSPPPRS